MATPDLDDPNFDGSVVLLLEHDADGCLGVVLNRPSPLPVAEAMSSPPTDAAEGWDTVAAPPAVVFVGGPVRPNAVIALARVPHVAEPARFEPVVADIGVIDLSEGPIARVGDLDSVRVFAGYAGWGAQQLEEEIDRGSWFVVEARASDCLTTEPMQLWRSVLRRQGGLFTTVTDSPVLN